MNFLVDRCALTFRQFQIILDEMVSEYQDIPLHYNLRWLSCGKFFERFVHSAKKELDLVEIKLFLAEKGQTYTELEDEQWLVKLIFFTDITTILNELNLRLQGTGQTVMDLYETWKAFVSKLEVYSRDITLSI